MLSVWITGFVYHIFYQWVILGTYSSDTGNLDFSWVFRCLSVVNICAVCFLIWVKAH